MRMITFGMCLLFLPLVTAAAAVPTAMNYQGRLSEPGGTPLADGDYSVAFAIYDVSSGGVVLWSESRTVTVVNGVFSVLLGTVTPIVDSVFSGPTRYLGIKVGTDPELVPRVMMVTVPYAFRAATVDGATGGVIASKVAIGAGHDNSGADAFAVGLADTASGDHAVALGESNAAVGAYSNISGGLGNRAIGISSHIGGGAQNTAGNNDVVVGGGLGNSAAGFRSVIAGGQSNHTAGDVAVVGGGFINSAIGNYTFIGGGSADTVTGGYGLIGGGYLNRVSGFSAAIVGGVNNSCSGLAASIGGGSGNVASDVGAVVCGGESDTASAAFAVVPGGRDNVAAGRYSFAGGFGAKARHLGTFVWSDSSSTLPFGSTGDNQFLVRAAGGVGINTNAPQSLLHVKAGASGSTGPLPYTLATFESSFNSYLSILTPNGGERGILFGNATSNIDGGIVYNNFATPNGFQFRTTTNNTVISFAQNGDIVTFGKVCATNVACPSDERLKEDIRQIDDPLELISQLHGVHYRWKPEFREHHGLSDDEQTGLIAQEVARVLPDAVSSGPDGYYAVDYSRLVPLLLEGIKQQRVTIHQLEQKLDALAARVATGSSAPPAPLHN
ncbi:MAG: tail fiber domain-containing protein [candidate division Zixibacteria bacterium]|nr:tail fiber domain-containing protein [candidate division Zixibacteria bacterium]